MISQPNAPSMGHERIGISGGKAIAIQDSLGLMLWP
jgi:hypothetical protein